MLIKAEHQAIGANVRYVVTNLSGDPQHLYDDEYVARGESCENSIKDLKNALKADRLSCHRFWGESVPPATPCRGLHPHARHLVGGPRNPARKRANGHVALAPAVSMATFAFGGWI